jgi:3-phosphoshikimate 1-carboxyvinyltransferase
MDETDEIKEIRRFPKGTVTPPPSKSLSHRAVICAALAAGEAEKTGKIGEIGGSEIENLGRSDDIDATLSAVKILFGKTEQGADGVRVIDCGESGSTLRFLLPIAAACGLEAVFTGRGRLLSRPLEAYAGVFRASGAEYAREGDRITLKGSMKSGEYSVPGDVSSQFVSGLLLALPLLEGDSSIRLATPLESSGYVDMTLDVMRHFGVSAEKKGTRYLVKGGQSYRPSLYRVEADYSQAAFFLAAAALGRDVRVSGLEKRSVQGDRAILEVLKNAGAEISWEGGTVTARANSLSAVTVDAREIPDLVPPIAALCCFCRGTSRIRNAGRLRLKESDRLHSLAAELGKLGADVKEGRDFLEITGREGMNGLQGGDADACGDHRIAMAIATAAIRCRGPVRLSGWRSVSKSYPDFWRDFEGHGEGSDLPAGRGGACDFSPEKL